MYYSTLYSEEYKLQDLEPYFESAFVYNKATDEKSRINTTTKNINNFLPITSIRVIS